MDNTHCFIVRENIAGAEKIVCNFLISLGDFRKVTLNDEQKKEFFRIVIKESEACTSQIGGPPEEKRFRAYGIVQAPHGYINIFPLHNRIGIDHNFSKELIEISRNTNNPILYSWQEHSTTGKAVFVAGKLVKSISYDTHGPLYTVDGKEFTPNMRQKGLAYPEPKALLPVEFHEYLEQELAEEQALKDSQVIVYLHKDIADMNRFFENVEENIIRLKKSRPFKTIPFILILLAFLILIVFLVVAGSRIIYVIFARLPILSLILFIGLCVAYLITKRNKRVTKNN